MAATITNKLLRCIIKFDRLKYLNTAIVNKTYVSASKIDTNNYKNEEIIDHSLIAEKNKFTDEEGNIMDVRRSDEFGLLTSCVKTSEKIEKTDEIDTEFVSEEKLTQLRTNYPKLIKKLITESKYQEAVDVLTVKMLKEEKIKPSTFAYNILIGAFGRLGNPKMAFNLYKHMTERALKPDPATYTSLFNACANSDDKTDGLRRASKLREKLKIKGEILNTTNYNSMIKAFGLCGDLWSAFEIGDEMISEGHLFTSETLNFLLMACASDREMGFGKALLLWREFGAKRKQPDVFSYNLLLRITRDCSVGSGMMRKIEPGTQDADFLLDRSSNTTETNLTIKSRNEITKFNDELDLEKAETRLNVFGDVKGFVNHMTNNEIKPNLKTFALLLEISENNVKNEEEILKLMDEFKIKPDIALFNVLIKKRVYRMDENGVKDAIGKMTEKNIYPDIITFGTLAIGCRKRTTCIELLESINSAGFRPNIQIMGALVRNMCFVHDFYYLSRLLQLMMDEKMELQPKILEKITKSIERFKKRMADEERGLNSGINLKETRKDDFRKFLFFYKKWLSQMKMESQPSLAKVELNK